MEKLYQFFAGYFHEDWTVDSENPDEVLNELVAEGRTRSELEELAGLIDDYLDTRSDVSLEHALFTELGCYYTPSADGLSARAWLKHVSGQLRAKAREQ